MQYDCRFLKLTKGFTQFSNHRDTKIMYYLLVSQDKNASLKLSDMSYELTDMGGYDRPLEDFKRQYIKEFISKEKERINRLKQEHKAEMDLEKKLAKQEKRKANIVKTKFPKAEPPKNEVDGSDFNYEWIPLEILHPYASGDVDACLRIHNKLDKLGMKPENTAIYSLYSEFYPNLTFNLANIESNGIKMNVKYNEKLTEAYQEEEERLIEEMRKFPTVKELEEQHRLLYERGLQEWALPKADRDEEVAKLRDKYKKKLKFNPNSSDDLKKALYEGTNIRLPFNKEYLVDSAINDNISEEEIEWNHYKTDVSALEYIKNNYPEHKEFAELLITYSLVKTRRRGFTYKLRNMLNHKGFLHGGFNPTGTDTTRLASKEPNLQQVPRDTTDPTRFDYKHPIKRMFVTRFEGGGMLQLDYSSLETRVLALAAGDEKMTQAFLDGKDPHKETASITYNVPIEEVTKEQRQMAKAVTFGISYGEIPFSFAPKHNMTVKEAERVFEDYFRNKPRVKEFIDETHEFVKKHGYIECLHGFRRNLRDVYSQDNSKRNKALRAGVNTMIQGSGAFLTNSSLIHIQNFIEKHNLRSKIILTVHDSIVIDCPPEEIHIMARAAKYIMENLPIDWLFIDWKGEKLRYPIAADVEIGVNYNDMVDYDKDDLDTFQTISSYCKYYLDLKKVKDYKESKLIDEDKFNKLTSAIESKKEMYQQTV